MMLKLNSLMGLICFEKHTRTQAPECDWKTEPEITGLSRSVMVTGCFGEVICPPEFAVCITNLVTPNNQMSCLHTIKETINVIKRTIHISFHVYSSNSELTCDALVSVHLVMRLWDLAMKSLLTLPLLSSSSLAALKLSIACDGLGQWYSLEEQCIWVPSVQ